MIPIVKQNWCAANLQVSAFIVLVFLVTSFYIGSFVFRKKGRTLIDNSSLELRRLLTRYILIVQIVKFTKFLYTAFQVSNVSQELNTRGLTFIANLQEWDLDLIFLDFQVVKYYSYLKWINFLTTIFQKDKNMVFGVPLYKG